jgi:hypothetical protein
VGRDVWSSGWGSEEATGAADGASEGKTVDPLWLLRTLEIFGFLEIRNKANFLHHTFFLQVTEVGQGLAESPVGLRVVAQHEAELGNGLAARAGTPRRRRRGG